MPTIDGGWLDQYQRFPPPGPQPPQKQPKQTVIWAKAFLRTSEDAELVMQGKSLEQEVSARPRRSDCSTRPDDGSHRLVECRPATPTSMDFAGRNIGEAQACYFVGTRAFSSSCQFNTICSRVGLASGSLSIITKRAP
jgi:hypothetical protein